MAEELDLATEVSADFVETSSRAARNCALVFTLPVIACLFLNWRRKELAVVLAGQKQGAEEQQQPLKQQQQEPEEQTVSGAAAGQTLEVATEI